MGSVWCQVELTMHEVDESGDATCHLCGRVFRR